MRGGRAPRSPSRRAPQLPHRICWKSTLFVLQSARRAVREYIHDLALALSLLHAAPVFHREQIRVRTEEDIPQRPGRNEEGGELLRKDIELTNIVPRLRGHLLLVGAGLRK